MQTKLLMTLSIAAALGLNCAKADAADLKADVMHWWTSGTEAAALRTLVEAYTAAGGEWVDRAVPDFDSAVAAATSATVSGSAPTALQFNGGSQFAELARSGYLADLTPFAERDGWKDKLSPALSFAITYDGKIYGLPVDTHNQLWLWTSAQAFKKAGVSRPKTWSDFLASLEALKAAGIIPIAQGGEPWQEMLLFESVLLFRGSPDLFQAVFVDGDKAVLEGPDFKAAVDEFRYITSFIDQGAPGRKWNDATAMVVSGKAAMQIMGDWAKAEFLAAGQAPDVDFGCALGVGDNNYYVAITDVFVLPKNDSKAAAQALFAKTVMEPGVQAKFNAVKGGLPPRLDATLDNPDVCTAKAQALLEKPHTQRLGPTMTVSADRFGAFGDAISEFVNTPNMTSEDFVAAMIAAIESTDK